MTAVRALVDSRGGGRRLARIAALVAVGLVAACGSDPSDRSSPPSDEPIEPVEPPAAAMQGARLFAASLGEDLAGLVTQTMAS